ncbi:MAG: hypothetical protein JWQ06_717 [Mucilaginibacter sp.]|nr:hypothetical protein [Mucilaginibacter sp.]
MSSIEEKLWDYIDGTCTPEEQKAISLQIEQDEIYRDKYLDLLRLNQEFSTMELDEPPMALAYNVMQTIRAEHAQKPLKATINSGIVKGISAFFVFMIAVLLIFILSNIHWSAANSPLPLTYFKMPDFTNYFSGPVIKGFLFFDVVLGLFLFDTYRRKKSFLKQS